MVVVMLRHVASIDRSTPINEEEKFYYDTECLDIIESAIKDENQISETR